MTSLATNGWKRNKVFGLDTVELIRMGGLLQQIKQAESRIENYLAGEISRIDELEVESCHSISEIKDLPQPQRLISGILFTQPFIQ